MAGIILNLPYTAQAVPPVVSQRLNLSPEEMQLENWRLSDPYLLEMAQKAAQWKKNQGAEREIIIYPYSPLVADPLELWPQEFLLEETGIEDRTALFLPKTTTGKKINWQAGEQASILARTVKPYHDALAGAAEKLLQKTEVVLILTLRSFNSVPWVFEKNKKYPRPQVTIGSLNEATPEGLAHLAGQIFKQFGWWPEQDWPHRSAFVPEKLKGQNRIKALGLSFCRGLYLDEKTGHKLAGFEAVSRILRTAINMLDQEIDRVVKLRLERLKPQKTAPAKPKKPSAVIKSKAPVPQKEYAVFKKTGAVIKGNGQ